MLDEETDRLVRHVRGGDRDAYGGIVTRHEAGVRSVLAAMLPDTSLVEDAAQEVFVTAYLKLAEYTTGTDFAGWIKAIARYVALNERRRWFHRQGAAKRLQAQIESLLSPPVDAAAARLDEEILSGLRDCVDALPTRSKETVRARYYEGRSCREIAVVRNKSEVGVRQVLFLARQALFECLTRKGLA
jgi:RNA polymerase sigma-70 factor, ECF subfamily